MSDVEEKLAGHTPAQIVGGMRVRRASNHGRKSESKTEAEQMIEEEQKSNQPSQHLTPNTLLSVNGTEVKLKDVNPTQAVKQFHEKPNETHKMGPERPNPSKYNQVFQPRRFNAFNFHERHPDQQH